MREIKFRAWNLETRRMVDCKGTTPLALHPELLDKKLDGLFLPFHPDLVLMQFTGLKDKNGKEIYEGDICLAALPEERFPVETIWCKDKAGLLFQWNDDTYESGKDEMEMDLFADIEVIGNIHENPKLLEK